jgi:hypothetical protein
MRGTMADAGSPYLNQPLRSEAQAISELGSGKSPFDIVKTWGPFARELRQYLIAREKFHDEHEYDALSYFLERVEDGLARLEEHLEVIER